MSDYECTDFEELYRLYGQDVFNMGLRNSDCNRSLADDATQQAFLKLYLTMRDKKPIKSIRNFLLTTAKHYVLNAQRINKHETYMTDSDGPVIEEVQVESTELIFFTRLEGVENYETARTLLEAMKKKNEKWYTVAVEVFYHNRSQLEVAEELGMTDTAMYAMIRRIREWADLYMKDMRSRGEME